MKNIFYFGLFAFLFTACDEPTPVEKPSIFVEDVARFEGNAGNSTFSFKIKMSETYTEEVTVSYETRNVDATAGDDFVAKSGTATIAVGAKEINVEVEIIGDEVYEADETFELFLSSATNATIDDNIALGTIRNDDAFQPIDDTGYSTPTTYPGYTLAWADEFDGASVNTNDWTFETGASGWGNQELQNYTNGGNASVTNGKLIIEARQEGAAYTSTRMITKGKRFFKYGRIDIRAKLPEGQGIWPALWMLGESISTVGWPACGEIDIMELVGHQAGTVHGTGHWSNANGDHAQFGQSKTLSGGSKFSEEYHVFSIIWTSQSIKWYVDDVLYNTLSITPADLSEFQQEHFFIFNVAVGGTWPGNPDATTVFPQRMIVDYVRVFQ
jgi:beta-glucanase (GH16 family)